MKQDKNQNSWIFVISFAFAIISYHLIFSSFFPNRNSTLGHDYSYFFPSLLNGYYWFKENGLFEVPWFTPAFCGGVPYLPNPQVMYYSLPQFLTFLFDPLASVYLTFMIFAAVGFVGFYKLSIDIFRLSSVTAAYAATIFMFNGFYAYRLIIGHLTYHAFMLVPLIALLLIPSRERHISLTILKVLVAGALIAYFIHSGAANFIVPAMLSIIGIWALSALFIEVNYRFWPRFFVASTLAVLLSSSKLVSGIAFISSFPRDQYSLPGIEGITNTFLVIFDALFTRTLRTVEVVNTEILFQQHSFEFGVTVVPLIVIIVFLTKLTRHEFRQKHMPVLKDRGHQLFIAFVLCSILILPILVNYYAPAWNLLLKGMPYIKNSSSLFRWIAIEIPLIVLISAVALEKLSFKRVNFIATILISSVVLINILSDKEFYHAQPYSPVSILYGYKNARTTEAAKNINYVGVDRTSTGEFVGSLSRNDLMVMGVSQLYCYEPIFGYGLEKFPLGELRPGDPLASKDRRLNFKNPACYIYGEENNCEAGDHFRVEEIESAKEFINYQQFSFKFSSSQIFANYLNLTALVLVICGIIFCSIYMRRV